MYTAKTTELEVSSMTVETTGHIGCLVSNLALGKDGKFYQQKQETFLRNNGIEWTSNRSKAIWNVALLLRNGDREGAIQLYRKHSIAYHKSSCYPKGIEGKVVKRFCEAQRPAVLKRTAAVLRFYTGLRLDVPSQAQKDKALKSITEPYKGTVDIEVIVKWTTLALRERIRSNGIKMRDFSTHPITTKERDASHLKPLSSYYSPVKLPKNMKNYPGSSMAMSLMTVPYLPEVLNDRTPCKEMRANVIQQQQDAGVDTTFGNSPVAKISLINEQGCKARVVCQPSAWVQLAFMPLNNILFDAIQRLYPKESCVFDQQKGAYAMMDTLSKGDPLYAVDLSSATDRFPRAISTGLLTELGLTDYATALDEFCNMPVDGSVLGQPIVNYTVGQPMGLYGSFPLFHLSNLVTADACVRSVKRQGHDPKPFFDGSYFKVLGDDIIMSDRRVAERYKHQMEVSGVEISKHKSFDGMVSEFAGFIGIKTNKSVAVFRPYKSPTGQYITNGIAFLDNLGVKVKSLSPYWERQYNMYRRTIGERDITLAPLVANSPYSGRPSNRLDNHTMLNICNGITISMPSHPLVPDLSGNTRISTIPLFQERGMFDYYGFNPDTICKDASPYQSYQEKTGISQDPLMARERSNSDKVSLWESLLSSQDADEKVSESPAHHERVMGSLTRSPDFER
uniref:RNA-dependent RNA polymerase n=1 Tax=Mitovirus JS5 TaxID=2692312 RepID=A0A6B9KUB3_9VIRU|nr:MAG: RNA-dependent RNA polymerase [Mitovirus JS5]